MTEKSAQKLPFIMGISNAKTKEPSKTKNLQNTQATRSLNLCSLI